MLTELSWLPSPPEGYREAVRKLKREIQQSSDLEGAWERLKSLAGHALDEVQLAHLAGILRSLPNSTAVPTAIKLAVLGDGTLSLLGPAIAASALRRDLRVEVTTGDYGHAVNDALDPASSVRLAAPDVVLVACDRRVLGLDRAQSSAEAANAAVEMAFGTIRSIAANIRRSVKRAVLVQTIVPPPDPLFGSFDILFAGSPYAQVCTLNALLRDWAANEDIVLVDAARLAGSVGLERWDDPQQWHASKLPASADMIPLYAD